MEIKAKKDRQTSTGVIGSPKKGGGGGKGTWGVGGLDDLKGVSVAGPRDPNYDSEEEGDREIVISETVVTSPYEVLIQEYLVSGDIEETIRSLKELHIDDIHQQFVKKALIAAMEKQAYERELVSKLLLAIYNVAVAPEKIVEGFQKTLNVLDDILLDTPDAVDILSKFLARAILDEVVAPSFLNFAVAETPLAEKCISLSHSLVNQPFRSERLAHVWGAGALSSVKRLKEEVQMIFEEYLTSADISEADRSVRELNVPYFFPQLVKQGLRLTLTKDEEERQNTLKLLAHLAKSGLLSKYDVKKGFSYCLESLDDLKLDVPNAAALLLECIHTAKSGGWLDSSFEETVKTQ